MTLNKASNFFKSLIYETNNKSEIKIYNDFTLILSNLENRDFSKEELEIIEMKLNSLNLKSNPQNKRKFFSKTLNEFKRFLNKTFSLVSKNYYTNLYITLGASFGIISGIIIGERFEKSLGIALGIGVGMIIGLFIGKSKDAKALNEGRVIK
ncbi:hypothetical protein DHD32_03525 [Arenibacter sp. TNZ]|uniref:hypothetical protein n=1 Tax=Arenibacter TaxID=178469 RepID=UPI000CD46357|nr:MULTISPECIES: hypothetical protein [Arenibacter]MCM4170539.1 hypothetical protein [Arenibacter sp. TNZ]